MGTVGKWVCIVSGVTCLLASYTYVSKRVPDAYMDEIFHVPQTQQYCSGNVWYWDPKITTLAGFHFLGAFWGKTSDLLRGLGGSDGQGLNQCSPNALRFMNVLLGVANLVLVANLQSLIHFQKCDQPSRIVTRPSSYLLGLTVTLLPLHFFFTFLFYTDVSSLCFVLASHLFCRMERFHYGAILGMCAVLIRQTNAVWITFILFDALAVYLRIGSAEGGESRGLVQDTIQLLRKLFVHRMPIIRRFWSMCLIPVTFVIFVLWNGGIVVGDRTAHKPVQHTAQIPYFLAFSAFAFAPYFLLNPARVKSVISAAGQQLPFSFLAVIGLVVMCVRGVFVHEYLLADNRHFTFYIWRRFLSKTWVRAALALVSTYAFVCFKKGMEGNGPVWFLAYCVCTVATLMPAGLLEFRYFLVPFVLAMLHMPPPSNRELITVLMGYVVVNVWTIGMFADRPFLWPDGTTARFLW